jgi:histidine ammonia-lyase
MGAQHRFPAFGVFIAVLLWALPGAAQDNAILLDGKSLTISQVIQVAVRNAPVTIAPSAMEQMRQSFNVLIAAAVKGISIYGVNYGVGQNKDQPIFSGPLTSKDCEPSRQFNIRNLFATSAGAGPEAPETLVRAAMLIRLNTMLVGRTGAQPRVAELYKDFLNNGIHPVLPTRASVGEADITILAHIGLAMMGEGDVNYKGRRMPAAQALADAKIDKLEPFGKDSLAIMSSNAYAAAVAVLAQDDLRRLLWVDDQVFALSLEALNGNVSPFLPPVYSADRTQVTIAANVLHQLEGSFLWSRDENRALQDPLSYRTASHVLAVAFDENSELGKWLLAQINSSDDNPAVIFGIQPDADAPEQIKAYYVGPVALKNPCGRENAPRVSGAVIPTGNFEPLRWVVSLQATGIALSHVSRAAASRITRLGSPEFTKLSRFLTPDEKTTLAYSAIQKTYAALDAEIQAESGLVSTNTVPLAGDIEDTATNSVLAANRLQHIVDNLYAIVAIELMHAAQAVDLRLRANPSLPLGEGTRPLFESFRNSVPFLDRDRELTKDITKATTFVRKAAGSLNP